MSYNPSRVRNQTIFYTSLAVVFTITMLGWVNGNSGIIGIPGTRLIILGNLFGLIAVLCILLEILLLARVPFVEENFNLHDILNIHRLTGYVIVAALSIHIASTVLGYAAPNHTALWTQFLHLNTSMDDILKATIGALLLCVATALSVHLIRSKMRYEMWFITHLFLYVAIALTFFHQLNVGSDFLRQQWFVAFWYMIYFIVFGLLGYYRFVRMFLYEYKHKLRVLKVVKEAKDTYSVYLTGKDIAKLRYIPGQYATWRFIDKSWIEAHPFSFSSPPGSDTIRITAKAPDKQYADHIKHLKPGTTVLMDGPRGAFLLDKLYDNDVVLIAGGIGIAPYLSGIEILLQKSSSVTLLYSIRSDEYLSFDKELQDLEKQGLKVKIHRSNKNGHMTIESIQKYLDSPHCCVYLCGPEAMIQSLVPKIKLQGIAASNIFTERFTF